MLIALAWITIAAPAQAGPPTGYDPALVVAIDVAGDRTHTRSHRISIRAEEGRRSGSAEERDARVWIATRTWNGGSQSVASTECPAVRTVALSFRDLPPVPITPGILQLIPGEGAPVAPTIKDGFETSLSFHTLTADGSQAEVTITRGNAYQRWGHDAVSGLISCWGPLAP